MQSDDTLTKEALEAYLQHNELALACGMLTHRELELYRKGLIALRRGPGNREES